MNKKNMTLAVASIFVASVLSACVLKPPDDQAQLGQETTADAINTAFDNAVGNASDADAYKVNDSGSIQIYNQIYSMIQLQQVQTIQVTAVTASTVDYSLTISGDSHLYTGTIDRTTSTPAPLPSSTPIPIATSTPVPGPTMAVAPAHGSSTFVNFKLLPDSLMHFVAAVKTTIARIFSRVTVEPTTALGESTGATSARKENEKTLWPNPLSDELQKGLDKKIEEIAAKSLKAPSVSAKGVLTTKDTTSKFYGLQVYHHIYVTKNTAQLIDGKIDAVHIEFNEVKTDTAPPNTAKRYHWMYEYSTKLPGIFWVPGMPWSTFLDQCVSFMYTQDNNQIPVTQCMHLDDFRYGSP